MTGAAGVGEGASAARPLTTDTGLPWSTEPPLGSVSQHQGPRSGAATFVAAAR